MTLFDAEKYRSMRVCVALSGGVDSVCLLHAFKEQAERYEISLSALHVEHGIRGAESARDMQFCKTLCEKWAIPLKIVRVDVPALAGERGRGVEETARAVRYGEFRALLDAGEADCVATAHHADDVAETLLFRLARGTGLSGMRAIEEYYGIVRPLLACTRAGIEAYAAQNNLPHVEDSTNGDENYTRNYIRKAVLPAFEKIHGNAKKHLVEFASLAAAEDEFLQTLAESRIVRIAGEERVPVDLPDVLFARTCLCCMRQHAPEGGLTRANLEEIGKLKYLQSGKRVAVPVSDAVKNVVDLYAIREGGDIVFDREYKNASEEGECPFAPRAGHYTFPAAFAVRELHGESEAELPAARLLVDLDAFPADCVVRARREGDVITPYHAPRKTLKKFLTDRKIPARLSRKLPVIAKGSEVYAVVGVEIADSVKVTEKTKRRGALV